MNGILGIILGTGSGGDRFGVISVSKTCPPQNRYLLLLTVFLAGCAGMEVTYVPLHPGTFTAIRQAKDIPIVTGTVNEPYEELGIILIRKYPGSLEEEIQEKFREEAMIRGAEAVINVRVSKQSVFSLSPFIFSLPFQGIEAKGVAIRFKKGKA